MGPRSSSQMAVSPARTTFRKIYRTSMKRTSGGAIESYVENAAIWSQPALAYETFPGQSELKGGALLDDRVQFAFGAQFVEVRVHSRTREVRAPRAVGAYAAGTIVNKTTAESQLMGGLIFGLSSALHEATEIDARSARYYNTNLAEYLIPVNADVGSVKVILVPENDSWSIPWGSRELGNSAMSGSMRRSPTLYFMRPANEFATCRYGSRSY